MTPAAAHTIALVVDVGQVDSQPDRVVVTVTMGVQGFMPPLGPLVQEGNPVQPPAKAFKQGQTLPLKLQLLRTGAPVCGAGVTPPRIVGL